MSKLIQITERCAVSASDISCLIADPPGKAGFIFVKLKGGYSMFIPPDEGKTPVDEVERLITAVNWLCQ